MVSAGPKESQAIASRVQAASAEYLEAPVLGSQPEASRGTLLIMVGSETNPQDSKAWPVLTKLSQEPKHMGTIGTAAATKLALNQLIASLTVSEPRFHNPLAAWQAVDQLETFMFAKRNASGIHFGKASSMQ